MARAKKSLHYLPVYTGDYLRDTMMNTAAEDGIYFRLLMFCWDSRAPLPLDTEEVMRAARAISAEERAAVEKVLTRYFQRQDDGWHNTRLELELDRAQSLVEARATAGRMGAGARWGGRAEPENDGNGMAKAMAGASLSVTNGSDANGKGNGNRNNESGEKEWQSHEFANSKIMPSSTSIRDVVVDVGFTPSVQEKKNQNLLLIADEASASERVSEHSPTSRPEFGFGEFWSLYPRKIGKGHARKAWYRIAPDDGLRERIMRSLRRQITAWADRDPQYIPHPTTWLNGARWEDEVEPGAASGGTEGVPMGQLWGTVI